MDYKKIFRSRKTRMAILKFLSFVPDKQMIELQYWVKTGHKLNLKNPKRYSEKIQWYKLYYRMPLMRKVADKATVKTYIEKCGYPEIIIPTIMVCSSIDQVTIDELPMKFVAKDTLGGGGNSVIVCRDKHDLDKQGFIETLNSWLKRTPSYRVDGREWVYGGKHRIIIEDYLDHDSEVGLVDYKFFCFNGRFEYLYVISNRVLGKSAELGIYDRDYNKLDAYRADEKPAYYTIPKPANFSRMIEIAEKLSKPFPYARIDLYNVKGKIYFGEITLTDGSGYMKFNPDSFDYTLGEKFILPTKLRNKRV